VWTVCLRLLPDSVAAAICPSVPESSTLTTRLPTHPYRWFRCGYGNWTRLYFNDRALLIRTNHRQNGRQLCMYVTTTTTTTTRTTWVSWYQKGKTSLDLNEARYDGVLGWQWHQLDRMQTICSSLQTDNHTNTSSLNFTGRMLFLTLNQQCQSTDIRMQINTNRGPICK